MSDEAVLKALLMWWAATLGCFLFSLMFPNTVIGGLGWFNSVGACVKALHILVRASESALTLQQKRTTPRNGTIWHKSGEII